MVGETDAVRESGRVVWVAERSFDFEGATVEGVFATEAAALAWLHARYDEDRASDYRPGDIWKRTSSNPHYPNFQWWEYELGSRAMRVTPYTLEGEPRDTEREAAGQQVLEGL